MRKHKHAILAAIILAVMIGMMFLMTRTNPYEKNGEPIGDIDGNGQLEYVVYSGEDGVNMHFDFIFNGEKIYEHDDVCVVELSDVIEYVDLDEDGEEEILLTMVPHVNSMPLMEYAVLKEVDGNWQKLEIFEGEDSLDNSFPISVTKGEDTFDAVISCEGSEKQIHIDLEPVYSYWKTLAKEDEEGYAQICNYYDMEVLAMAEGARCGVTCDWGIWNIELNSFHGKPCLKAEQGIEGFGKEDFWGSLYLYFDYDEAGKIRVLDMEFEPNDCH